MVGLDLAASLHSLLFLHPELGLSGIKDPSLEYLTRSTIISIQKK
jgi:hypothetical protein